MKPQNNKKKREGPLIGVLNVVTNKGTEKKEGEKLKPPCIKNPRQMESTEDEPTIISHHSREDHLRHRDGEGGGVLMMEHRPGRIKVGRGEMGNYGESRQQRRALHQSRKGRQRKGSGSGFKFKGNLEERCLGTNNGRRKEVLNIKEGNESTLPPGEKGIQGETTEGKIKRTVTSECKDEGPSRMGGIKQK